MYYVQADTATPRYRVVNAYGLAVSEWMSRPAAIQLAANAQPLRGREGVLRMTWFWRCIAASTLCMAYSLAIGIGFDALHVSPAAAGGATFVGSCLIWLLFVLL